MGAGCVRGAPMQPARVRSVALLAVAQWETLRRPIMEASLEVIAFGSAILDTLQKWEIPISLAINVLLENSPTRQAL